ncbi:MAG: hypothetical protein ACP5HS_09690 [Anaerolineae bacterium]
MLRKTESLAWLVLVLSFFTCLALATGVPLGARWTILNSTRPLTILLEGRAGSVTYRSPNSGTRVVLETGRATEIEPRSRVQLDSDGDALLLFYHPDQPETPVGTVQLYGQTDLLIENARTPRFAASKLPHRMQLEVAEALNMRPTVAGNGREAELDIETPQGTVALEDGSFKLVVEPDQTELKVSAGRATIIDPATGESLVLVPLQRTEITAAGLGDISIGERDVLANRNGDFGEPIEGYWTIYTDKFDEDEAGGEVLQVPLVDGNRIVAFERVGQSHAETGIRQEINLDIREAESLQVRALIRIGTQTLPVCGSVGTECPLMIRIEFVDRDTGGNREWLQGFYAREGEDIPFCTTCEWKAQHIKVPPETWYDYESENLLPILRDQGVNPAVIREIRIYAQGWTYSSAIDEIGILVGE